MGLPSAGTGEHNGAKGVVVALSPPGAGLPAAPSPGGAGSPLSPADLLGPAGTRPPALLTLLAFLYDHVVTPVTC